MTYDMKNALQRISLASQNSMSSKDECGRIAREALAAEEARESKSWHDEHAEDLQRRREQHALATRDYEQRFEMNAKLVEAAVKQIAEMDDLRRFRAEDREYRAFHHEHTARQTTALEAIAATLIRLTTKEKP
ncbi:MAG: hypothetical protein EBT03_07860 [Betaproteobacteria bacterium]|nr:hypothetical protein [Betaproteobacteria bacterium]